MTHALTPEIASQLAALALGHVTREYPNKLDHVMTGPEDVKGPRELHPLFHGSFDWHSCVHGHWLLARILRLFPGGPGAAPVRALLEAQLTGEKVAAELAYLQRPSSRGFERPYGWAWLLLLAAELARYDTEEGRRWSAALAPLGDAFAERFLEFLPRATYPVRAGAHTNTAFALALALEYAAVKGDERLSRRCAEAARAWYGRDADCQAWEPSQDDFLSPALMEAECMRRVLPGPEFRGWFARFLPRAAQGEPATLFQPATVSDRSDGKIAHLDGLNLSRAWCWRSLAAALPGGDPVRARALDAVARHLDASLPHLAGDYMGEHWLASFALLALSDDGCCNV
ncbi:DUF2891 domain-containing protein [Sorangium sp. So ce119]|uniref:DUF2891 domain-containing protein n=1 Tax=Sorangium sp. So ce119 TaxID=3133279 RepID=UPI003F628510